MSARPFTLVAAALALAASPAAAADPDLNLSDLAGYRKALAAKPGPPPAAVTFRDLWQNPKNFQGRSVRVSGSIVRQFHQGAVGTFPPLVETWVVSPDGDPLCLVYPDPGGALQGEAAPVEFAGTFLRLIPYRAKDTRRLVPLIVGPAPPVPSKNSSRLPGAGTREFSRLDWVMGTAAAIVVLLVLVGQHTLRKPQLRRPSASDPPPTFLSPTEAEGRQNGSTHDDADRLRDNV